MKKKIGLILLALMLIVSMVAGCNGDSDVPAVEEDPPETAPALPDEIEEIEEENEEIEAGFEEVVDDLLVPEVRAFNAWLNYVEFTGAFDAVTAVAWAADFIMDMEIDISIMTISMLISGDMAFIQTDDLNMELVMSMSTDLGALGGETESIIYMSMVDGVMNMRMITDGYEMPSDFIDLDMVDEMTDIAIPEFSMDDILSVDIEDDANYTTYRFHLDASALNDFMQEVMGSQMDEIMELFGDDAGITIEFGDEMPITLVVRNSDETPISLAMDMSMSMIFDGEEFEEMDGEEMFIRMNILYVYTAFGDDVVVSEPPMGR